MSDAGDGQNDAEDEPHASHGAAQRVAEAEVLRKASAHFRRELIPTTVRTPPGLPMKVDGVADDHSVLVEVYVRRGCSRGTRARS